MPQNTVTNIIQFIQIQIIFDLTLTNIKMIQYILQILPLSHDSNDNNIYQYNYNNTL